MSNADAKKTIDTTTDTTQRRSILSGFKAGERFDDRIDTGPEISHLEAVRVAWRGLKLLRYARGLFASKLAISVCMLVPGLFLSWFGKIVIDHVIMEKELIADQARFPPHMKPLLAFLEGMGPMEIMLALTVIYGVGLFLIGVRGTGELMASTFGGSDAASGAENELSEGWASAGGIVGIVEYWIAVRLSQRIGNTLRTRLFARLTHSPMTTIDENRVGDSLYRVMYDTSIAWGAVGSLTLYPLFTFVNYGLTMYQLDYTYSDVAPEMIWIAWIMLPVVFIVTIPMIRIMRRVTHNSRAAGAATTNATEETLSNIGAVQSLGGMKQEKERFAERSAHAFWRGRINNLAYIMMETLINSANAIIGIAIAIYVSNQVIGDVLTVGDYFALFFLYMGIAQTASAIGDLWINIQDRIAPLRRVLFFIDYESDEERYRGETLGPIQKGVELEEVDYIYPDGRQALKDINLDLPIGQLVAFVGPTGAGKTSLAYLIPAFLRPTRGRALVDGRDIENVSLDSLRDQVAYVFQEHQLLSESIRDNLLLANPGASEAQVMHALETAGCMEFINELPDGIDTVLGRSGDTLSVGQQQRLSIARGLIRDARILILDEPTAALDPHTENELVQGLLKARVDKLVIVIAHRLSTIRRADRIVFLEAGEIRGIGSHDELMADPDSPYRRFVELQGG
jgi:ABC-type multidrug transport system fused ATPase/permease subunit